MIFNTAVSYEWETNIQYWLNYSTITQYIMPWYWNGSSLPQWDMVWLQYEYKFAVSFNSTHKINQHSKIELTVEYVQYVSAVQMQVTINAPLVEPIMVYFHAALHVGMSVFLTFKSILILL